MTRLLFILLIFSSTAFPQTPAIDHLKSQLPSLTGKQKADCLNTLANEFTFNFIHSDSALIYAAKAKEISEAADYPSGKGLALIMHAEITGRLLGQPTNMLKYAQEAEQVLLHIKDHKTLNYARRLMGVAYTLLGKNADANKILALTLHDANRSGDLHSIGWTLWSIGFANTKPGHTFTGFQHLTQSSLIGKQIKDSFLTAMSLVFIARSFNHANDPQNALNYYYEFFKYVNNPFMLLWPHMEDVGLAHWQLKQYDSALYYQQLHYQNISSITADQKVRKKFEAYFIRSFADAANLGEKKYTEVITKLEPQLKDLRFKADTPPLLNALLLVSKAYEGRGQFTRAIPLAKEMVQVSEQAGNKYYGKEGYQLLSQLYERTGITDSAYAYYRKYISAKEAMDASQYTLRTTLYTATAEAEKRFQLLNTEKQLQEQKLAATQNQLQQKSATQNLLLIGLASLLVFIFMLVRNNNLKRRNDKLIHEQQQTILQKKAVELEMQALRAQMNPHLIFNCLSAIDNLVQTKQTDKATLYLARFAKLIRAVLDSSKNNLVPFHKDYEAMQLYLEMEQFRCNNKFSYNFNVDDELMYGDYKVPPLIIQPFIENAIHHGLLNKQQDDRQLSVTASLEEDFIVYMVTDNGIGRHKAAIIKERNKPEHHSYGIGITRERISLHNHKVAPDDVQITDLEKDGDALGTTAIIRISKEPKSIAV
ncbi:MAG TPA: histidine kinase [Chitinophagaceae bacterium]